VDGLTQLRAFNNWPQLAAKQVFRLSSALEVLHRHCSTRTAGSLEFTLLLVPPFLLAESFWQQALGQIAFSK
jgi:hypothetical protein